MTHFSKWKNIFGERDKAGSFDDVNPKTTINSDGSIIDVSSEFVAVNWNTSGGGAVGIFRTRNFERVKSSFPLIYGHTAIVSDIKFSPLNPFLLATSSDDGKVKIWNIPADGLKDDLREETQRLTGHKKKVNIIQWNPVVSEVIASFGNDNDLLISDITKGDEIFRLHTEDPGFNIEWNSTGSQIISSLKSKNITIWDVRSLSVVSSTLGHDTAKIQRSGFADGDYIYSSGHNSKGFREIKLFDRRNFKDSVQSYKLDSLQGMLSNYYDSDLGVLYLHGKGEGVISYLEIKDGVIKEGSKYSSTDQASGIAFFPKRTMDYNNSELARCAIACKSHINYISFKYPRRNQGFQEEFYPHCVTGEAGLTFDEWKSGKVNEQPRKAITEIENKFKSEIIFFEKKKEEPKKTVSIETLTRENCELTKKVNLLQEEVENLKLKLKEYEGK
jgi:coronin-1B/1C/6